MFFFFKLYKITRGKSNFAFLVRNYRTRLRLVATRFLTFQLYSTIVLLLVSRIHSLACECVENETSAWRITIDKTLPFSAQRDALRLKVIIANFLDFLIENLKSKGNNEVLVLNSYIHNLLSLLAHVIRFESFNYLHQKL